MATLVHDDVIDAARLRRGRRPAWATHGPGRGARGGDYLFARAFAELAATGDDAGPRRALAARAVDLARGEAMQRAAAHDPDTPVDAYLERCALKTAKLFEASCLLASRGERRLGAFGLALGVAFQVADDILDCSGLTTRPGRSPAPTCATARRRFRSSSPRARTRSFARRSRAGSLDGALVRVAATGALERSREVALDYAPRARAPRRRAARGRARGPDPLVVERSG